MPSVQEGVQEGDLAAEAQVDPRVPQARPGLSPGGLPGLLLHDLQPAAPHPQGSPGAAQVQVLLPRLRTQVRHAG